MRNLHFPFKNAVESVEEMGFLRGNFDEAL
jgi:hypothetical protein